MNTHRRVLLEKRGNWRAGKDKMRTRRQTLERGDRLANLAGKLNPGVSDTNDGTG